VADRRWAEMKQSAQEVRALHEARNGPRPVLRGTAVPGNAWEDYSPALAAMKGAPSSVLGEYFSRGPKADRQKLDAAIARYAPALDGMRKGAMRADGIYRMKWEEGFTADIPGLVQSQNLSTLAACRARLLAEEGKPREAAELLLDTCQFAHDLGYNQLLICEMISNALYGVALEELRDLILGGKLSKTDLEEIDRELALLDASFPRNGHSLVNEAMNVGYGFQKWDGNFTGLSEGSELRREWNYFLWRTAFPTRLICADAYFTELDHMKRFAAADEESWAACETAGARSESDLSKVRNPVVRVMMSGLTGSNRAGRERRTHLRLIRAAAHYRATGKFPDLEDPFGATLLTSDQNGKVKIWSIGRDRLDNGGNGAWKANAGPDIVLEFEK
jgi:hypothetical protein